MQESQENIQSSQKNSRVTSEDVCQICKGVGGIPSSKLDKYGQPYWDMCECKIREIENNRLKFAEIPEKFKGNKIGNFKIDLYSAENQIKIGTIKKMVIKYIEIFNTPKKIEKGFYFYSATAGSGKTRMAVSIGNALDSKYKTNVRFSTTIDLLNKIKSTFDSTNKDESSKFSQKELLSSFKQIEVLILDDIGTEKPSSWVEEILFNILNSRMENKKITIFTSNCEIENLKYSDRLRQRIKDMSMPIAFPEESIRTMISEYENEKYLRELIAK